MTSIDWPNKGCFAAQRVTVFAAAVVAADSIGGGFTEPAEAAHAGWQPPASLLIRPGILSEFVHEDCPGAFPLVVNGAFAMNVAGQTSNVSLSFNGPRIDLAPPNLNQWGWHFFWLSGAPSGLRITFSVFCQ